MQVTSNSKKYQWLGIVETLSAIGSIGGAIASVISQQVAFTSIPLSLSVTLNLMHRRLLLDEINQHHKSAIATLSQANATTENNIRSLSEQLDSLEIKHNQAIASLNQENAATGAKIGTLSQQLAQLQQLTHNLGQDTNKLQDDTQNLHQEQTKLADVVSCLREISTCTQSIRIDANNAKAYYQRGLAYQRLAEREAAIGDYTAAINVAPNYAAAYHTRGLVRADLGDKKGAVADLRTAAKLFFAAGDIVNYQTAREQSKKVHELSLLSTTDVSEEVVRLFA